MRALSVIYSAEGRENRKIVNAVNDCRAVAASGHNA